MIGNFGDRNTDKPDIEPEEMTPENWTKFRLAQEAVAQQAIERVGAKLETHKFLVLVDLQGIYLGLHKWLSEKGFPIDGGLVLSRLAFFQIHDVLERIKAKTLKSHDGPFLDYEDLLEQIRQAGNGGQIDITPGSTYLRVVPQFELFYAPAPLDQIEWQLRLKAKSGSIKAQDQLSQIKAGILKHPYFERDYAAYDDFVSKLKENPEYSRSEKGFFSYFVGPNGLKVFDEKEVDTRIVIRAMDAFYNYEVDTLCIVSSDQDFLPVHTKAREFGIQSYQADLAKFRPDDQIARKFGKLGSGFLRGQINAEWPLRIIIEATSRPDIGHQQRYKLAENEFTVLCEMHNNMNDFHVSLDFLPDGKATMTISKPAK